MELQARTIAGVPVLIASPTLMPGMPKIATPVVLWFHGFRTPGGALAVMLALAEATVHELPALIDDLAQHHGADPSRVSAVGISMGAFLLYRAIAYGIPLRAAVALLGSPEWPGPSSAHRSPDSFTRVRLLSITAEHDVSVPPAAATRFHEVLRGQVDLQDMQHHHVMEWLQRFG